MNLRKLTVMVMVMAMVLGTALQASAGLIQSFAGLGQRASDTQNTVTVKLAILDRDGKLVAGLKRANFKLYSSMGLGLPFPGTFNIGVTEVTTLPGTYLMKITPAAGNSWQAMGYKFGFVAKKDNLTNGVGEVLVLNLVSATTSSLSLTPEQKTQVLQLLSPPQH